MVDFLLSSYRVLLQLYPRSFRERYENEMIETFRDMMRDGARGRMIVAALVEVPLMAYHEHLLVFGKKLESSPRKYVVGLVAAAVVALYMIAAPILISTTGSAGEEFVQRLAQYHLPAIVVIVSSVALLLASIHIILAFLARRNYRRLGSARRMRLRDIWPVLAVGLGSLIVVGLIVTTIVDAAHRANEWRQQRAANETLVPCTYLPVSELSTINGAGMMVVERTERTDTQQGMTVASQTCTYEPDSTTFPVASSVILGVRTQTAGDKDTLKHAFLTNIIAGESAVKIQDYDGFSLAHDGSVELRLWVDDTWLDIHAGDLDTAHRIADYVIPRLVH